MKILALLLSLFFVGNLFASDDLTLVCKGIEEFYTIPLVSDSEFKKKAQTYIFKNSQVKTESFLFSELDCKFEKNFITCRSSSNDVNDSRSIKVDRNSGTISDSISFPFAIRGAKFAHTSFEGVCQVGKKQF